MEALRIHLTQASANYKREEIVENKMTYPLPPFSTVIGALHNICGFKEYRPMDISIQGDYHALNKEPYIDHCFLNSTQDDRGILIKMYHSEYYSKAYQKAGYAMKSQGNSFRNDITVMAEDEELLKEYRYLKDVNDKISEFKKGKYADCIIMLKQRKNTLAVKKKSFEKGSEGYKRIESREQEIKSFEQELKDGVKMYEDVNYSKPISKFRTLTTSLKYYEVLFDIELIIHVKSDTETLHTILDHIYEWKALGRSEDFIDVKSAVIVELEDKVDSEYFANHHAYLNAELVENEDIIAKEKGRGIHAQGTKYYMNKNYKLSSENGGKRIFEKKKVYYMSGYSVDSESRNVYIDKSGADPLIVNFL